MTMITDAATPPLPSPTARRRRRGACLSAALALVLAAVVLLAPPARAEGYDQATMYDLTNQSRADNGFGALQWDPSLANIAQQWATYMAGQQSLSHNPNLSSQVTNQVTSQWTRIGENVGYAGSLDSVENAFMGSSGHRANILGDYNRVGIGVAHDANGTDWVVVNFLKGPDQPGYQPARPAAAPQVVGWYLRTAPTGGSPSVAFAFGLDRYQFVKGDWDGGGGADGIGAYVDGSWYLRRTAGSGSPDMAISYGYAGAIPVVGDWNGDGVDTIGVYDNGWWYLRNSNTPGPPDIVVHYGAPGYLPVVGDWNGDGVDTIGVYAAGSWYLRNANAPGAPDLSFAYGSAAYTPVVGDWNGGTGPDGIGVFVGGSWYLRTTPSAGRPDITASYGTTGYRPVPGDWGGQGVDGLGVIAG